MLGGGRGLFKAVLSSEHDAVEHASSSPPRRRRLIPTAHLAFDQVKGRSIQQPVYSSYGHEAQTLVRRALVTLFDCRPGLATKQHICPAKFLSAEQASRAYV